MSEQEQIEEMLECLKSNWDQPCSCTDDYTDRGRRDPDCGFCRWEPERDECFDIIKSLQAQVKELKLSLAAVAEHDQITPHNLMTR